MKVCTNCKISKDISNFGKHYAKKGQPKDGLQSWCKVCCKEAKLAYKKNNKEKEASYNQLWWLNNRSKGAAYTSKRRAKILKSLPSWLPEGQREHIKMFYELASKLTSEIGIKFEVDHIVPLQGKNVSGLHVPWNLQVITKKENASKGNR